MGDVAAVCMLKCFDRLICEFVVAGRINWLVPLLQKRVPYILQAWPTVCQAQKLMSLSKPSTWSAVRKRYRNAETTSARTRNLGGSS